MKRATSRWDFVDHISHLAPSTIRDYSNIVKAVVASAINEKAEEPFPRKWNEEFIDAPIIEKQNQTSSLRGPQSVASGDRSTRISRDVRHRRSRATRHRG